MRKCNLRWGIVIANKERDDDYRVLNYQYIQAQDLEDADIDRLCSRTEELLTDLCSGNIDAVYRTLVGFSCGESDCIGDTEAAPESSKSTASLLQRQSPTTTSCFMISISKRLFTVRWSLNSMVQRLENCSAGESTASSYLTLWHKSNISSEAIRWTEPVTLM